MDPFPDRAWERPEVVGWNRLPSRPPLVTIPGIEADELPRRDDLPGFHRLDGAWAFRLYDGPEGVPDEAVRPELDDRAWARIEVPGVWTRQGFDRPHYTNVQMPFAERPPRVPEANPTGVYRREVELRPGWTQRRVVLHLGGAESLVYVFANGRAVGLSKDSRLACEFDLTPFLHEGRNQLAIVVVRYCDGSFLEDQDHWFHAGLHREVFLRATAPTRFDDVQATADLDEDGTGRLRIRALIGGLEDAEPGAAPWSVHAELRGPGGRNLFRRPLEAQVATRTGTPADAYLYAGAWADLEAELPRAAPWSAETPSLHSLRLRLVDPEGRSHDATALRLGFRRVEVLDRELRVNGEAIRIRGVNRHDHHPVNGKTQSVADYREELLAMKRAHINAVRTAHYPNDPQFLDLCDELGFYVVGEANVEAHAYWAALCRDPRWTAAFVDRGQRMVQRDRNHPSVIVWSLGNESGYGPNHGAMAGWIRHADPTRPIQYEGGHAFDLAAEAPATDIVCPMYTPVGDLVAFARSPEATRPIVMCEYSHAMGNSNGGLDAYVDAFERVPGIQGGFIWDWKDQGLLLDGPEEGAPRYAHGGAFGDEPNDGSFCWNGLVGPDGTPHPALHEVAFLYQPLAMRAVDLAAGRFRLENRRHFTDLSDLRGRFEVCVDGRVVERGALPTLDLRPGEIRDIRLRWKTPSVAPGERAWVDVRFMARVPSEGVARGDERAWAQFPLPKRCVRAVSGVPPRSAGRQRAVGVAEGEGAFRLTAPGLEGEVGEDGSLRSLRIGDEECLAAPSRLQVFRAPTCNDGTRPVAGMPHPFGRWQAWGLDRAEVVKAESALRRGALVSELELSPGVEARLRWTADAAGLHLECRFEVPEALDDLPRLGVGLGLERRFDQLSWVGRGPHECYPDRQAGARLGRFEARVGEQRLPYGIPQEHGLRTQVSSLVLLDEGGRGLRVRSATPFAFSALRHRPEDLARGRLEGRLQARDEVWLSLDRAHRGVGTGACGPEVAPAARIRPGRHKIVWHLEPVGRGLGRR